MVDVSVIITSFNTRSLLRSCLMSIFQSLVNSNINYEVIVVDNASSDGSTKMIKDEFTKVRLIENDNNHGFSMANNQGGAIAKGKYLLFLNSDTEVIDSSIEKLYTFGKLRSKSICGGRLLNTDGTLQDSCGPFYSLSLVILWLFFQGDRIHLTRSSPSKTTITDWVSGACLFLSKENFQMLGGFDQDIFMYMEDVDLCYRAKKNGREVVFFPEATFVHVGSASSADKRSPYINVFRGLLYFYKKHWPHQLSTLRFILKTKAILGICIGFLLHNRSLTMNYQKALLVVKNYV